MKYKSELIKEIVESRGHEKSTIHYESECVESWIEETKGAYPKLCDYQSEWLNYINENPIGNFPYELITDVTEATVNNVVPYAYKSAILSGQTLVNLVDNMIFSSSSFDAEMTYSDNTKSYFVIIESNVAIIEVGLLESRSSWNVRQSVSNLLQLKIKLTPNTTKDIFKLRCIFSNPDLTPINAKCMIIEYQEGMENWDIPYFEGMKSVQMPVLTTTGKNLFDKNTVNLNCALNGDGTLRNLLDGENNNVSDYIAVKGNTQYAKTTNDLYCEYDINKNIIRRMGGAMFTTSDDCKFIRINVADIDNYQLEEGYNTTSYEPYKSNILTVNEDVELRDIKDSKYFNGSSIDKKFTDVLDCINGELKIQTNKVTMDGNKQPILSISKENVSIFKYKPNDILINSSYDGGNITICDKLKFVSGLWEKDEEGYCYSNNDGIMFSISNNKFTDINEYLNQNPITFIYPLTQESIKTVDLSIQDQDGNTLRKIKPIEGTMHIHSDGTPLNPSITMEIPVEATTQNLASFIKGE